jgi:hypothetical protein
VEKQKKDFVQTHKSALRCLRGETASKAQRYVNNGNESFLDLKRARKVA